MKLIDLYPLNLLLERLRYLSLVVTAHFVFLIHFMVKVTLGDASHFPGEITCWDIRLTVAIVNKSHN